MGAKRNLPGKTSVVHQLLHCLGWILAPKGHSDLLLKGKGNGAALKSLRKQIQAQQHLRAFLETSYHVLFCS